MQDTPRLPSDNDPHANRAQTDSSKSWSDLQRDLDSLGRQLGELRLHTASLGEELINRLQKSYDDVKSQASAWRVETERQLDDAKRTVAGSAQGAYSDARIRSKEAARQVWEKAEPLRKGAKDVGEGLTRAWTELRASFGKAAGRLQTENGKQPSTTNSPGSSDKYPGSS